MSTENFSKTIVRVSKNRANPYVMIDKRVFENPHLSWKAKGIMGYLLSRPDDWQIYVRDLINRSKDGRDAVYAGLKELKDNGYIQEVIVRNDRGQIVRHEYVVFESPDPDFPDLADLPDPDFPDLAKPDRENPPLLIKKDNNKEKTHTPNDACVWDKPDFLSQTIWRRLLKRYGPERVQEVLSWVPIIQPENPAGYVTMALKDEWVEPAPVRQARIKQAQAELAAQAQRQAQAEAEALKVRQAQELEALYAWWDHLAPEIQERLRDTVGVDDVVRAGLSAFVAPTILMQPDPTQPSPLWLRVARHKMQEQGERILGLRN